MAKIYPTLEEILSCTRVVSVPLVTEFRGVSFREAAIIVGPKRWAEFSPFLEYSDVESANWLQAALEFGWGDLPPFYRTKIPINATVPAVLPGRVESVLERFVGCETVKIKVAQAGQTLGQDVERVRRVRKLLPYVKIRLDANGGWSVEEAEVAIKRLVEFGLEYVEQPVATVADLVILRKVLRRDKVFVLIAADESIRKAADPFAVERLGAADIVVLKVPPLGGVWEALRLAEKISLPVVVSSCLDTSIGVHMGLVLAAALPCLPYACGLGTASLLAVDVVAKPLVPVLGYSCLGSQVVGDVVLLEACAVSAKRVDWWFERIARVYKYLVDL